MLLGVMMDAVDLITSTMQRVTSKGFNPREASWDHKVCVMLHAAQGIIDNGGFEYFFERPFDGDPLMEDFPKVFEAVGANSSANAVREAIRRSQSPAPKYDDLNNILWRDSENNHELLSMYITAHASSYA
jgi:hypothetical protein